MRHDPSKKISPRLPEEGKVIVEVTSDYDNEQQKSFMVVLFHSTDTTIKKIEGIFSAAASKFRDGQATSVLKNDPSAKTKKYRSFSSLTVYVNDVAAFEGLLNGFPPDIELIPDKNGIVRALSQQPQSFCR